MCSGEVFAFSIFGMTELGCLQLTSLFARSVAPEVARQSSCVAGMPAKARRLHARLHDDAEEAELGSA